MVFGWFITFQIPVIGRRYLGLRPGSPIQHILGFNLNGKRKS
jgi:hypothetical protein